MTIAVDLDVKQQNKTGPGWGWSFFFFKIQDTFKKYDHVLTKVSTCRVIVNLLLHNNAFLSLLNTRYLKILWEMECLLLWSKCSIFHNIFKIIQSFTKIFLDFFSMLSKNRK